MTNALTPREVRAVRLGPGAGRDPERADAPAPGAPAAILPGETLAAVLEAAFARDPGRRLLHFVNDDGTVGTVRAGELRALARAVAAGLRRAGVGPGDAVLLAMDTSPALVASFVACVFLGATPCITDLPFSAHGAPAWREKFRARAALVGARVVVAARESLPLVRDEGPAAFTAEELSAEAPAGAPDEAPAAAPESPAFFQFTSGTVSGGRAIRLSNRAVVANLRQIQGGCEWTTTDLFVSWLPLYHDLGLVGQLLAPLAAGLPAVLLSPLHFLLRPASWLWAIHYFRGTVAFAPNFAFEMCAAMVQPAKTEGLDLGSLHSACNCAEFIHTSTLRRFAERYAPHGFRYEAWRPAYGMAEAVVGVTVRRRGAPLRVDRISRQALGAAGRAEPAAEGGADAVEIVSVGPPLPGVSARVVGPGGEDLPERHEGVVMLSGPSIFDGYQHDPEATSAVLRDGWLSTGDLGYLAGGELFICGRAKDLIIKGGENYHPYAFERAAADVPGLRAGRVAALGVPNPATGTEDFCLAFETEEGDPERLREICSLVERELLRRFGVRPDRVAPIPLRAIPKTTSGKIRRGSLAQKLDELDKLRRPAPGAAR
ncbi:MAG TPA: AMP-binding protein [Polyangiaceae bacterium]|nr:AMP-binding protein [Polyangiaceae bacterium]